MLYVNGQEIADTEIEQETERMRLQYEQAFADQPESDREKQLREWSRENVIERILLQQAAARLTDDVPDEVLNAAFNCFIDDCGGKEEFFQTSELSEAQVRHELNVQLRMERLMHIITEDLPDPSGKEIQQYFQQNQQKFTIPEMVRAAHIVMHPTPETDLQAIEKQMQQILVQLHSGTNFGELAQKHSDCPDNQGDLGYFARGKMVQEFEDVVFNLSPGQISDVFQTEFGFHIAKVLDKRPPLPAQLEDVQQVIVRELTEHAQQKAMEDFVDAQKEKAVIEEK
ncbi:MAG: peptidylprolyl isomerase [Sedimentisphaerales bacterium]|nr:peptidylprolyl isomerase [Sedimentisphaerales bacterium]